MNVGMADPIHMVMEWVKKNLFSALFLFGGFFYFLFYVPGFFPVGFLPPMLLCIQSSD